MTKVNKNPLFLILICNAGQYEWKDLLLEIEKVYSQWPDHSLIYHEMPFELDYLIPEETFNHVIPKRDRERLLAETHVVSDAERESTNRL